MPNPHKIAVVEETTQQMRSASAIVLTDYIGLSAPLATELRAQMRENDVVFKVVKKTLTLRAAKELGIAGLAEYIDGQLGLAIAMGEPSAPAKVLGDFGKKNKGIPAITGLIIDGQLFPAERAKQLASLPSKEILLGQLVGVLSAPLTKLASTLNAPITNLAQVLSSLKDTKSS